MKNTKKDTTRAYAYDYSVVREYYKIIKGFIFSSEILARADRIKDHIEWRITCEDMPDVLFINKKRYNLVKVKGKHANQK